MSIIIHRRSPVIRNVQRNIWRILGEAGYKVHVKGKGPKAPGPESAKKDQPEKSSYEMRIEAGLRSIVLTLPKAYHTVLQNEAKACGLPRGVFMTQVLRANLGQINFTSRTQTPYAFGRNNFSEKVRFVWSLKEDAYQLFQTATHYGAMPPSAWAMAALDSWLGPDIKPRMKE